VQLEHFYKKQSIKHILCSQSNNGAAFVPDSETSFARLVEAEKILLINFVRSLENSVAAPKLISPDPTLQLAQIMNYISVNQRQSNPILSIKSSKLESFFYSLK
jgi:hypothetical protein